MPLAEAVHPFTYGKEQDSAQEVYEPSTGGRWVHPFLFFPPLKVGRGSITRQYGMCTFCKEFFTLADFNFCQKLQQVITMYLLSTGAAAP